MRKLSIIRRIMVAASLALLVLLICFQAIPLTFSESDWLAQTSAQSTRAQRIVKNALTLAYRPDAERAQAVSELQNTLPAWESQQARLQTVHSDDLRTLAFQAQPDFAAIDTAARKLLAHPKDLVQVSIIVEHERSYSLTMLQLSALLQRHIDNFNLGLVLIEQGIAALLVIIAILHFLLAEREQRKYLKEALALDTTQHEGRVL